MSILRQAMPVLARHVGEWRGTYTLIDLDGNRLDRHASHLICQFPPDSPHAYSQINRYLWESGKQEEHHFWGTYRDGKLWFETDRIQGSAWEVDAATLILRFAYPTLPDFHLYEMIQISACNQHRARTWHWFNQQQIYQRTLIQEERVVSDAP